MFKVDVLLVLNRVHLFVSFSESQRFSVAPLWIDVLCRVVQIDLYRRLADKCTCVFRRRELDIMRVRVCLLLSTFNPVVIFSILFSRYVNSSARLSACSGFWNFL